MSARVGWRKATLALVALLVAGVAVVTAPDDQEEFAPIDRRGAVGETVAARALDVRVDDVRVARGLEPAPDAVAGETPDTGTRGAWVVVDATVTWNIEAGSLGYSVLRIGDREYRAADILPQPSLLGLPMQAGVPVSGSFVFEVPRSALDDPGAARAELRSRFAVEAGPDTVPVVEIDLADAPVEESVVVDDAREEGLR